MGEEVTRGGGLSGYVRWELPRRDHNDRDNGGSRLLVRHGAVIKCVKEVNAQIGCFFGPFQLCDHM